MPRVNTWSRAAPGGGVTAPARMALQLGTFPAGSTLERVLFSFILQQNTFYGGNIATTGSSGMYFGVINRAVSLGPPDFDPPSSPGADWLWAMLMSIEVIPIRWASAAEFRVQWSSPKEGFSTESRRHNGLLESQAVWLVSRSMSVLNSGNPTWFSAGWGSVLYSQLTP